MNKDFFTGFRSAEKTASQGTHIQFIRTKGLSDDELGNLRDSVKHVGDARKANNHEGDWRDDAIKHFSENHPHLKDKVSKGGEARLSSKHRAHVLAVHHDGKMHVHGHYMGGEPSARFKSYYGGIHEKVAGSLGSGRVDRFLKALKKQPKLLPKAHAKVRARDLTDQLRGTVSHVETSLEDAVERAKKTQAKGGFKGTDV